MRIGPICAGGAGRAFERAFRAAFAAWLTAALLASCAAPEGPPGAAATPAPPAASAQSLDAAAASLTDALLAAAPPGGARRPVVIDPLIDRATGAQTTATRSIAARMTERIRDRHPEVEVRPFTTASLAERPLIILGSMAGVAAPGSVQPAVGRPRVYRVWATLADLQTNQVLTREMVWVEGDGVDTTPAAFFRDSPVWSPDPVTAAYIRTCSSTRGTAVDPVYLQALFAQALAAEAVAAHDAGRHQEALDRYTEALRLPGGDQLRVLNGVYLANWALGRRQEAEAAFARAVDHGLAQDRLAVKLLFRPGSTAFWPDPLVSGPYPMWLRQIARRAEGRAACLVVSGHTSPTGPAALNERLSLARAERVRARLAAERPGMRERTRAEGHGTRQPIVGTGADDATDALDRRVEFRPLPCPTVTAGWRAAPPAS
jgi:outer membrane protein OmpA-like peptidoglycan-associated protein